MKLKKLFAASLFSVSVISTTAFAGTWRQNETGWWYENSPKSYAQNGWQWIDGNNDGIAECYRFDERGYLMTDTTTPDGYTVDKNGAWTVNGAVQEQLSGPNGISILMDQEGSDLYEQASRRTSELGSLSVHSSTNMTMVLPYDYGTYPMSIDTQMKLKNAGEAGMKYLANIRMNLLGTQTSAVSFYADGWFYMEMYGQKLKYQLPMDAVMQQARKNTASVGIDTSYFDQVSVKKETDGRRLIHYSTDTSVLTADILNVYKNMGASLSELGVQDISVRQLNGTAHVNAAGYLTSDNMELVLDMTIDDAVVSTTMRVDTTYEALGKNDDFTLPSTEGYEQLSSLN